MTYKSAAIYYCCVYAAAALSAALLPVATGRSLLHLMGFGFPFLLAVCLATNYNVAKTAKTKPANIVMASMVSSLSRLISFSIVLVVSVFFFRETIIESLAFVGALYIISTASDVVFSKKYGK
jgi:hypothetical protein